jgi:phosphoribosyl 1,2-cyclic phosphodiesterase
MISFSLQSGSNGNSIYVEAGNVRLLFDAGICGSEAERRLATHGRDIRRVDAVIVSHDHADHIRHAGVYERKFGLPLFITQKTLREAQKKIKLGPLKRVHHFMAGGTLDFGTVSVHTIPTPHDGADGVVFVLDSGGKRLGILTDLGHVFDGLPQLVPTLDGVFLESNYDPAMLEHGPYPAFLKNRIKGPHGHISNGEAAELLREGKNLQWACLAHLSEKNNYPRIALDTHRKILSDTLDLHIAGRHQTTALLKL